MPRVIFPDGELFKPRHVDLDVEVPGVCEYRAVLHRLEVFSRNDAAAPGDGDEHIAHARRVLHRHDLVPVHDGFERADRVDLGDDDLCAQPLCAQRHALAAPAVAGDDNVFASDDEVRRAVYTVPHGLTSAVAVIKHVLAVGLVDHDHREAQLMVLRHDLEPVYAGGRLLAAADDAGDEPGVLRVHEVDKVAAVVDYDIRPGLEHAAEAVLIFLHRAAVACKDLHAAVSERRGDVILRRERVRAGDVHLRAAHFEHAAEIRRLCLKVYRQRYLEPGERLRLLKVLTDTAQHRHVALHPVYFHFARGGEGDVFYLAHSDAPYNLSCN